MRTLPLLLFSLLALPALALDAFQKDTFPTSGGDLEITFIGHGSLLMTFAGKTIYVDPFSKLADYAKLPKADLIVVTHEHPDHLDVGAIDSVRTRDTKIVLAGSVSDKLSGSTVMRNGDVQKIMCITVEAVPAYNLVHKRDNGQFYHPKGQGNGYVLTLGDKRVYIAGDTENTPEMKGLRNIDIAFLPMNLPYTMTSEMVADAALAFRPKVLYPYHFGGTDTRSIVSLLKGSKEIDVRIRNMK
jgi:L-ascorbate metabolism protein UlaG (beta-lactamase superfamily)